MKSREDITPLIAQLVDVMIADSISFCSIPSLHLLVGPPYMRRIEKRPARQDVREQGIIGTRRLHHGVWRAPRPYRSIQHGSARMRSCKGKIYAGNRMVCAFKRADQDLSNLPQGIPIFPTGPDAWLDWKPRSMERRMTHGVFGPVASGTT